MSRLWLAVVVVLLAGCGGGASRAPANLTPAATAPQGTGRMTITITIPASTASTSTASAVTRAPAYVSGSAQSIAIGIYPVVGGVIPGSPSSTVDQDLTATSPGCSGASPNVCSISIAVPLGVDAFSMELYSGTGEQGNVLSQLDPTSATERTIVEGTNNVVLPLILSGVPASLAVSAPLTTFHGGTTASIAYTVVAQDASGNTIVGDAPYETAITPTASDGSAFSFSPATITSPTTSVTLLYNGNATSTTPTFSASVGAITAAPISLAFVPAALGITCQSACTGLTNATTAYELNVTEAGYSGSVSVSASGTSCNLYPVSVIAVGYGTGHVYLYPPPGGGTCVVTATDSYTQTISGNATFNAAAAPTIVSNCMASTVPPDPNGGTLYPYNGCLDVAVQYGAYYFEPLQSNTNPPYTFQIAAYANVGQPAVSQFQVSGNRYITGASVSSPNVVFTGQYGNTNVPFTSFAP
jgi:hypothetical protein